MVLKIERPPDMTDNHLPGFRAAKEPQAADDPPTSPPSASATASDTGAGSNDDNGVPGGVSRGGARPRPPDADRCAGCGRAEGAASGPLMRFEDPEDDPASGGNGAGADNERRFCPACMTGKKVRVFWPVDSQWYVADVRRYDAATGEHLLAYPDGDTEWVRIGEDHTTGVARREHAAGPRVGVTGGSARCPQPPPPPPAGRPFPPLHLDRTASSMSSFGMYGRGGTPSFGPPPGHRGGPPTDVRAPYQLLSPAFSHSFSSRAGGVPADFGPPPVPSGGKNTTGGGYGPPPPYPPPPGQREEGSAAMVPGVGPDARDSTPWPPGPYSPYHYEGRGPPLSSYAYSTAPPPPPPPRNRHPYSAAPRDAPPPLVASPRSTPGAVPPARDKARKALAKAWTGPEDERLLDLVLAMKHPLKWSVIAQALSDSVTADIDSRAGTTPPRTGKQCRERYVNHLNPRLRRGEFGPREDATIWRLYATVGTQWAKMSKVIPGRTDNNLKNRFHNLKRQLQREEEGRRRAAPPKAGSNGLKYGGALHEDRVREVPAALRTRIEDMWDHRRHLAAAAAATDRESPSLPTENGAAENGAVTAGDSARQRFGSFIAQTGSGPILCGRCGLLVPSAQCGDEVCARTGWCRACARASLHLCGNVLREALNLRRDIDENLADGADQLLRGVWDGA